MKPNIKYHMSYIQKKLRWYPQQLQCIFTFFFCHLLRNFLCILLRNLLRNLVNLTWPCTNSQNLSRIFSATFSKTHWPWFGLAPRLRNLLRNPVEPDLALHHNLPDLTLLNLTWLGTFSGTFFGILLNLTWLCTKPSHTFSGTFSEPVELDFASHQSLQEPCPEPFSEPCYTWPGFAPKPPGSSLESFPEPCWTWPGSVPKHPGTSSGTFSGTLLNLTGLCTKASRILVRNLFWNPCCTWPGPAPKLPKSSAEPSPEPCWTWPSPETC